MKTEATRERSSLRPVSFSTIEASVTNSSSVEIGRSGWRRSQMSSTSFFWSATILSMICWRVAPRVKRIVSVARLPSAGMRRRHVAGQRFVLGDALERLLDGQSLGNGQRIEHRLAALQDLHDVVHGGAGLDLVFAGLELTVIADRR